MSVCNIFKRFDLSDNNGQGIFLTFSQYTEDKTLEMSYGANHRVVPSKFLCLNLPNLPQNTNTVIPQALQSEYENRLAFLREATSWSALYSRYTLFRTLRTLGLLSISEDENHTYTYFNEIVCGGDINVISNRNIEGTNYSEIYCLVEPSTQKMLFKNEQSDLDNITINVTGSWVDVIKGWSTDGTGSYPEYPGLLTHLDYKPIFDENTSYYSNSDSSNNPDVAPLILDSETIFEDPSGYAIQQDSQFTFNCIIVFYDVYDENGHVNEQNRSLPLGIWFSGPADENDVFLNPVTKFVRSETIFGQGTSYGLRICLKNVSTPFGAPVALEANDHFCAVITPISELCDRFAQASVEMQRIAESSSLSLVAMKDWAAIFMNSRINVPYIKTINGEQRWFVNGRNVGPVVVPNN